MGRTAPRYFVTAFLLALIGCQPEVEDPVTTAQSRAAVSVADSGALLGALDRIAGFHERHATGLELNPPSPELEQQIAGFPCQLSEEVKLLWRWRDGEETDRFIWYHRFLPAGESLRQYRLLRANLLMDWHASWIPLFEFEGEWYATVCKAGPVPAAPILHYFVESGASVAYTNLATYMATMAEGVETGALAWEDGWWRENLQQLAIIHARNNPGLPFPYYIGD